MTFLEFTAHLLFVTHEEPCRLIGFSNTLASCRELLEWIWMGRTRKTGEQLNRKNIPSPFIWSWDLILAVSSQNMVAWWWSNIAWCWTLMSMVGKAYPMQGGLWCFGHIATQPNSSHWKSLFKTICKTLYCYFYIYYSFTFYIWKCTMDPENSTIPHFYFYFLCYFIYL